uniref:Uncharacterized protein n=1 Tax=Arundo donax TaxID=35708 RepID=A0A0A9GQ46_ARUDO
MTMVIYTFGPLPRFLTQKSPHLWAIRIYLFRGSTSDIS